MRPSNDHEAITLILEGLSQKGVSITEVADDTWNLNERTVVTEVQEAIDLSTGVDEAYVFVLTPDGDEGWIRFVLGNDPEEVVCDHTVNLSEFIDPIVNPWWV